MGSICPVTRKGFYVEDRVWREMDPDRRGQAYGKGKTMGYLKVSGSKLLKGEML